MPGNTKAALHPGERLLQRASLSRNPRHSGHQCLHLRFGHFALCGRFRQLFRQQLRVAGKPFRQLFQLVCVRLRKRRAHCGRIAVGHGTGHGFSNPRVHPGALHCPGQGVHRAHRVSGRLLFPADFFQPLFSFVQRHHGVEFVTAGTQFPLQVFRQLPEFCLLLLIQAGFFKLRSLIDCLFHGSGLQIQRFPCRNGPVSAAGQQERGGAQHHQPCADRCQAPGKPQGDLLHVQAAEMFAGILALAAGDLRFRASR